MQCPRPMLRTDVVRTLWLRALLPFLPVRRASHLSLPAPQVGAPFSLPQLLVSNLLPSGARQKGSSSKMVESTSLPPMDGLSGERCAAKCGRWPPANCSFLAICVRVLVPGKEEEDTGRATSVWLVTGFVLGLCDLMGAP